MLEDCEHVTDKTNVPHSFNIPTFYPTINPSINPTSNPTTIPTSVPTITVTPTSMPTIFPTYHPSLATPTVRLNNQWNAKTPKNQNITAAIFASILAVIIVLAFVLQLIVFVKRSKKKTTQNQQNDKIKEWTADHAKWYQNQQILAKTSSAISQKISNLDEKIKPSWNADVDDDKQECEVDRFRAETLISEAYEPYDSSTTCITNSSGSNKTESRIPKLHDHPSMLSIHLPDDLTSKPSKRGTKVAKPKRKSSRSPSGSSPEARSSSTFVSDLKNCNVANDVLMEDVIFEIDTLQQQDGEAVNKRNDISSNT